MAWINWIKTSDDRKMPVSPVTGAVCDAHDTAHHVTYDQAAAKGTPALVITPQDDLFFIDVDHCKPGGQWSELAVSIRQAFPDCYAEVSQSGEGLHIIGTVPPGCGVPHKCKRADIGLEFYTQDRFCAITGTGAAGSMESVPDPGVYTSWVTGYFAAGPTDGPTATPADWTTCPDPVWAGPVDNGELLKKMLASKGAKAALGFGVTFRQLWEADENALSGFFPDAGGGQARAFDWSQADGALCAHLAFWTGRDCARIDELWSQSSLADRDKFAREDYRQRTILNAVGICHKVYRDMTLVPPVGLSAPQPEALGLRSGYQYLCPEDQVTYFEGCYYVQQQHKIYTPHGILKPDQFKTTYGGWAFANDDSGQKTTRNAWDAFSESHVFKRPMVHDTCFRPDLGSANVIETEGRRYINTYVPIPTATAEGDPRPFLGFLEKLLPDTRDREILTSYLAAVVQYPGVKFQWAPVIQGTYGNGKSLITTVLEFCVGKEYAHKVNAQDIDNAFNSWLTGKLLIVIDEIQTPAGSKAEEMLKWFITDARVPIMAKGQDQTTGDNRANFILCSNHHDAVRKHKDDRRYAPFFTAQQSRADMAACGMTGDYFPRLYSWLRGGGHEILNGWLRGYSIAAEFNPAEGCTRAPDTSSTEDAIIRSATAPEQDIYEAVAEGRPGFRGGWVSSIALRRLMDDNRRRLSALQRGQTIEGLGYVKHPALHNGRAGGTVAVEGGRPVLYVKEDSIHANIYSGTEALIKYQDAQGFAPGLPGACNAVSG